MNRSAAIKSANVSLERDGFLRQLLRHLSGVLEDTVGLQEAEGFISVVGQRIGDEINAEYRQSLSLPKLSREQVAAVLVDLKARIQGDFYIVEQSDEKIVLRNNQCPFGDKVINREALCMMTTNVFGVIAADNLGYARVHVEESIARSHPQCAVTVFLSPTSGDSAGVEFFSGD